MVTSHWCFSLCSFTEERFFISIFLGIIIYIFLGIIIFIFLGIIIYIFLGIIIFIFLGIIIYIFLGIIEPILVSSADAGTSGCMQPCKLQCRRQSPDKFIHPCHKNVYYFPYTENKRPVKTSQPGHNIVSFIPYADNEGPDKPAQKCHKKVSFMYICGQRSHILARPAVP